MPLPLPVISSSRSMDPCFMLVMRSLHAEARGRGHSGASWRAAHGLRRHSVDCATCAHPTAQRTHHGGHDKSTNRMRVRKRLRRSTETAIELTILEASTALRLRPVGSSCPSPTLCTPLRTLELHAIDAAALRFFGPISAVDERKKRGGNSAGRRRMAHRVEADERPWPPCMVARPLFPTRACAPPLSPSPPFVPRVLLAFFSCDVARHT